MNLQKELFSHAATVFAVANVEESLDYYENKLGFKCNLKWNDHVDYAVYQEFSEKKISINTPIRNREYGMREFDVRDPDGYIIGFGMNTN